MISLPLHDLDLRPLFASGKEPYPAIMAAVDQLAPGQGLRLVAPMRPLPLFSVMAKRGFTADETQLAGGDWQIIFTPRPAEPRPVNGNAAEALLWPDPVRFLDLESLPLPTALPRILETLQSMRAGEVLFAALHQTDATPQFPALEAQGHEWAGNFAADGQVFRLMVRRGLLEGDAEF